MCFSSPNSSCAEGDLLELHWSQLNKLGSGLVSCASDRESRAGDPASQAGDKWLFTAGHENTDPKCNHIYCYKKLSSPQLNLLVIKPSLLCLYQSGQIVFLPLLDFLFPPMTKHAFLGIEFVAPTACLQVVKKLYKERKRGKQSWEAMWGLQLPAWRPRISGSCGVIPGATESTLCAPTIVMACLNVSHMSDTHAMHTFQLTLIFD